MYYNSRWSDPGVWIDAKDGRVCITPLRFGRPQDLIVEADGYERAVLPEVVPQHTEQANEVKIVMLPIHSSDYSTLHGQILDHLGKGIAGVQLRFMVSVKSITYYFGWWGIKYYDHDSYFERYEASVTDDNGNFAFPKILPGRFIAVAYWSNGVPKQCWFGDDKTRPGKDIAVRFNVPKPASVRGTIDRKTIRDPLMVDLSRNGDIFDFGVGFNSEQNNRRSDLLILPPADTGFDWSEIHKR